MIRVLVVEDSEVVRNLLCHILNSDPEIQVVAVASDGEEALEAVERSKPDVITMDVRLPKMDGFEATRRIMKSRPTPIVIVSGIPDITEKVMAMRAMEAGALAIVPKTAGVGHPDFERAAADLVRTVKLMSEVKVVRRWGRPRRHEATSLSFGAQLTMTADIAIVAIGASTGGPPALQSIVSGLPSNFSTPILVVQHLTPGFVDGFADWLGQYTTLPVHVATHAENILPGHIYVAPDGHHMQSGPEKRIMLGKQPAENGLRPSVASLFRSVAAIYGENAVGILLSGMGNDGSSELKLMKDQGAVTIAQDRETSTVHGMPGEAIRLGGVNYVLRPQEIALALVSMTKKSSDERKAQRMDAAL